MTDLLSTVMARIDELHLLVQKLGERSREQVAP